MKKLILFMTAIAVMMTLIGCPPATNTPTTEPTLEETNKAASGLKNDITVIGKIEDTTCDIELNAAYGTFSATQSSRSGEVSYSGEFFYYNGKLQLKVTKKNQEDLSDDNTFCLTATLEEEVLTNNETVIFETQEVTAYETAKTEFRAANPIKTVNLAGLRFVADTLTFTQSLNGEHKGEAQTAPGCTLDFVDGSKVMMDVLFSMSHEYATYTVSGNNLKIELYFDMYAGNEHEGENVMKATLTGKVSSDGKTITGFGGEFTQEVTSYDAIGNTTGKEKIVFSFSNGTFTSQGAILNLAGKIYKATKAKCNNADITGNIELTFTDSHNFTVTNGSQSLISFCNMYLVQKGKISLSAMWKIGNSFLNGALQGTISSDYKKITVTANLTDYSNNTTISLEFEFSLDKDTGNPTTSTTIAGGTESFTVVLEDVTSDAKAVALFCNQNDFAADNVNGTSYIAEVVSGKATWIIKNYDLSVPFEFQFTPMPSKDTKLGDDWWAYSISGSSQYTKNKNNITCDFAKVGIEYGGFTITVSKTSYTAKGGSWSSFPVYGVNSVRLFCEGFTSCFVIDGVSHSTTSTTIPSGNDDFGSFCVVLDDIPSEATAVALFCNQNDFAADNVNGTSYIAEVVSGKAIWIIKNYDLSVPFEFQFTPMQSKDTKMGDDWWSYSISGSSMYSKNKNNITCDFAQEGIEYGGFTITLNKTTYGSDYWKNKNYPLYGVSASRWFNENYTSCFSIEYGSSNTTTSTTISNQTVIHYTIKFNANGGSGTLDDIIAAGGEVIDLPNGGFTPPAGKKFIGWDVTSDGSTVYTGVDGVFKIKDMTTQDGAVLTLYAIWGDDVDTYTVAFDTDEGTDVASQTIVSGNKASKPENPEKDPYGTVAYVFDGWYTSDDLGETLSDTTYDFDTEVTSDITLYAKWIETDNINSFESTTSVYTATITAEMMAAYGDWGSLTNPNAHTVRFILVPGVVDFTGEESFTDKNQCYLYANNDIDHGFIYDEQIPTDGALQIVARNDSVENAYTGTAVKKNADGGYTIMIDLSEINKNHLLAKGYEEQGDEVDVWGNFDRIENRYVPYLIGSVTGNYFDYERNPEGYEFDITMWYAGLIKMTPTTESLPTTVKPTISPMTIDWTQVTNLVGAMNNWDVTATSITNGVATFEYTGEDDAEVLFALTDGSDAWDYSIRNFVISALDTDVSVTAEDALDKDTPTASIAAGILKNGKTYSLVITQIAGDESFKIKLVEVN